MIKQLGFKTLMSVLIIGEIMTISVGILNHMNTEEISIMIAGFAGVWIIFILVSVKIFRIVN